MCEPLQNVDWAGMCKVNGGVLTYGQMCDGAPLLESRAEGLGIDVEWVSRFRSSVTGTNVEADVNVAHAVTESEHAGRGVPDARKNETADGICEGGMESKGVEDAGCLVVGVEVEGVVEERGNDAEELSGDEKRCGAVSGREEIGSGGVGRESESKYAHKELFWEGCEGGGHEEGGG